MPAKKGQISNPEGKGGFKEHPEIQKKGPPAYSAKVQSYLNLEAIRLEEAREGVKRKKLELAFDCENEAIALKACESIQETLDKADGAGTDKDVRLDIAREELFREHQLRLKVEERLAELQKKLEEKLSAKDTEK